MKTLLSSAALLLLVLSLKGAPPATADAPRESLLSHARERIQSEVVGQLTERESLRFAYTRAQVVRSRYEVALGGDDGASDRLGRHFLPFKIHRVVGTEGRTAFVSGCYYPTLDAVFLFEPLTRLYVPPHGHRLLGAELVDLLRAPAPARAGIATDAAQRCQPYAAE